MPRYDVDDLSMFYRTRGEGDPVLLIHGLGSDNTGWEFQEEDLAKYFHLIMPDLRGHGTTTVTELGMMISPDVVADDLSGLLEHLGHEKVHVVGISLGGMVAQNFVLRHPDKVDKLVLVDTTPKVTEDLIDVVYSWREAQVEGGDEAYFWTSLRSGYSDECPPFCHEKACPDREAGGYYGFQYGRGQVQAVANLMSLHGDPVLW